MYDLQKHPLFMTLGLNSLHHGNFHEPDFPVSSIKKGGPSEPWHSLQTRGPDAWDGGAAYGFPNDVHEAYKDGLVTG